MKSRHIPCPHCGHKVPLPGNSAFVMKTDSNEPLVYIPKAGRRYKTTEHQRRTALARYYSRLTSRP